MYVGCTDWTGKGKNWGPKQQAEQQTYRLGPGDVLEEEAKTAIELQLLKLPTAFGGMRYATLALLPDGNRMVVKRILKEGIKLERNRKVLEVGLLFLRKICWLASIAGPFASRKMHCSATLRHGICSLLMHSKWLDQLLRCCCRK